MKSQTFHRFLSLLFVIVLLSGCGSAGSAGTSSAGTAENGSSGPDSAESEVPEKCEPELIFHDIIVPIGQLFVWELNSPEKLIVSREDLGTVYVFRTETAPDEVDLARDHVSTEGHERWKHESAAMGLFDCETITHSNGSVSFRAICYLNGFLYQTNYQAPSPADMDRCREWFVSILDGIRPTEEAAARSEASSQEEESGSSEPVSSDSEDASEESDTIKWTDLIRKLNGADSGEFEALYAEAMEEVAAKGLTEDWDAICRAASAYLDYTNNDILFEVGENYRFYSAYGASCPYLPEGVYLSNIRRAIDAAGLDTPFMERIYTSGNKLEPAAAVWLGPNISKYGYPETAPERQPGDPVRVLIVCLSQSVIVDGTGYVTITPLSMDTVAEDVMKLWDQFFADIEGASWHDAVFPADDADNMPRVRIVTDPADADVILRYDVDYPFAGSYGPTGGVSVYNCHVDVSIRKPDEADYLQFHYENNAGGTVTARSGSSKVWMYIPGDIDNEIGTTILSWFPDA